MQIRLTRAELWLVAVDAIVYPTTSLGIMGDALGGRVRRHAGALVQREAMAHAPIAVGAAVVTGGGTLLARSIIHVPVTDEPGTAIDSENLRKAARAALIAAERHTCFTIAMPVLRSAREATHDAATLSVLQELLACRKPLPEVVHIVDPSQVVLDELERELGYLRATVA